MSTRSYTSAQAQVLVEQRLDRPVQDALEAAVVLEAWNGVGAEFALPLGQQVATLPSRKKPGEQPAYVAPRQDRSIVLGDVAYVVGVLFVGFWLSSVSGRIGGGVDRAWRIALPVSLGIQWLLRRRYLAGADGLGRLRTEPGLVIPVFGLLLALSVVPSGGPLAVLLTLIWVGGFILTRRGWGVAYGLFLVSGALGSIAGLSPKLVLVCAGIVATVGLCAAIYTSPISLRRPAPWRRSLPAAAIGAGMGLLLVVEPEFAWSAKGVLPALTVVPSLVGSLWGGMHMTKLWEVMPRVLSTTAIQDRTTRVVGVPTVRLLASSLMRLVIGATLLSAVVAVWVETFVSDSPGRHITYSLLIAHGVLAVAGLSVALLDAFGRWGWAIAATMCGLTSALVVPHLHVAAVTPGVRILLGALVCAAVAVPPLVRTLFEPDRNIAVPL